MKQENFKKFLPRAEGCPVRSVLCRFGDKWSMLVLLTLSSNGTMRFSAIHSAIGDVSHRMLTVTLRTLESDGLIERKVYGEVPPRVEYNLSQKGEGLMPHVDALVGWAMENMPKPECCGGSCDSKAAAGAATV